MTEKLFALLLAGTLIIPQVTASLGNDTTVGVGSSGGASSSARSWGDLRLPPVPHFEMMPWMQGFPAKDSQVETLWGLKADTLGPFLVQPDIPGAKFSTGPKISESPHWTE